MRKLVNGLVVGNQSEMKGIGVMFCGYIRGYNKKIETHGNIRNK